LRKCQCLVRDLLNVFKNQCCRADRCIRRLRREKKNWEHKYDRVRAALDPGKEFPEATTLVQLAGEFRHQYDFLLESLLAYGCPGKWEAKIPLDFKIKFIRERFTRNADPAWTSSTTAARLARRLFNLENPPRWKSSSAR
jgi:hypothetical protein